MRLFFDLSLQKFVVAAGTTQILESISVKRSPTAAIEVQFLGGVSGITPQELPSDVSGIFEVKTAGQYDSSPLTAALAWVKTGTGEDTLYTFTLGLINDPLDDLLGVDALSAVTVVAATDLFTSTAHGLVATNIIQFSSTVTLPAGVSPNTNYYVITSGLTANDFKVSLTLAGSTINVTDTGSGIHSWRRLTNDVEDVTLMSELQYTTGGQAIKSQTLDFILINDVVREGDVPLSSPALVYAVFLPEIDDLSDFSAVATIGISLGFLVEILVEVTGVLTWLTYRLEAGPVTDSEPEQVEPDDYNVSTNDKHWQGAAGPPGGTGVSAGISYKWNTNTATSDPGSGKLKVNNATLASATSLFISETDDDANALAAMLATWDDSGSTIRGRLLVSDPDTPTNFAIFDLTGTRTDNGAWDTFSITPVTSGGTLTNNLPVKLFFSRTGDRGTLGGGFRYTLNSAITSDPGTGKFLFNNATFLSATTFSISETDGDGNSLATFLTKQDDSTSTNKCLVTAQKADAGFFSFYITGTLTDNGTYDTFAITPISSSGSPANDDVLFLTFDRTGDKGDTGATGGGVPDGGTTGQVLGKNSGADQDTDWLDVSGSPAPSNPVGLQDQDWGVSQTGSAEQVHHAVQFAANALYNLVSYIRIKAWGTIKNGTTAITYTPRIRIHTSSSTPGGLLVLTGPLIVSTTTALDLKPWEMEAVIFISDGPGTDSVRASMSLGNHTDNSSGLPSRDWNNTGATDVASFDGTVIQYLQLTWEMSATTGSPNVKMMGYSAEIAKDF